MTKNHFHNILRLFNVLSNFPFTTSESIARLLLTNMYIRVAELLLKFRVLRNKKILRKCLKFVE